jgi:hypothetical protein
MSEIHEGDFCRFKDHEASLKRLIESGEFESAFDYFRDGFYVTCILFGAANIYAEASDYLYDIPLDELELVRGFDADEFPDEILHGEGQRFTIRQATVPWSNRVDLYDGDTPIETRGRLTALCDLLNELHAR